MRVMKKVMTGMSLAAAALVIAGGVNAANADAAVSLDDVSVSGDATMSVTSSQKEIRVSYDAVKYNSKLKTETLNAKAKWDVYDVSAGSVTVDLSTLKLTKDVYVTIKDETDELPLVLKFTANKSKLTGKYGMDAEKKTSTIVFAGKKVDGTSVDKKGYDYTTDEAPALEYRTLTAGGESTWTSYKKDALISADEMNKYEKQGATLYFRFAGNDFNFGESATDVKDGEDGPAIFKLATQVSGNFAGAEAKVKIAKEANAPSATIDYDKGVFKIKTGTEYRTEAGAADWTAAGTEKTTEVPIADITQDGIFELRTAASAKKVASKIAIYTYKGVATPVASDTDDEGSIANGVRPASGGGVTEIKAKDSGLNITYAKNAKGKVEITFSNTNADAAYVIYSENPATVAKPKTVATVKAKGATGYKDIKVAETKLPDETKVWICTASDKKNNVFRSKAAEITIDYNVGLGNNNRES